MSSVKLPNTVDEEENTRLVEEHTPPSLSTAEMDESRSDAVGKVADVSDRPPQSNDTFDAPFLNFVPGGECAPKSQSTCIPAFLRSRIRFLILFVSMLFLTFTRANELSFNFTVICMVGNSSLENDTPVQMSKNTISAIFACIGLGAIAFALPLVLIMQRVGSRYLFSTLLLSSSIATFLMTPAAKLSPILLAPLRVVQGFALAAVMTVMGQVVAHWSPVSEIGKFITFLSAASQFSLIITMPLSAFLCVNTGWSSVYILIGILSGSVAVLFFTIYRDSPEEHPCVSTEELKLIRNGEKSRNKKAKVPYWDILRSKAVWGIWIAFLGNSFGFQLIIQFMPIYLNKIIMLHVSKTGMASFLPPFFQLIVKFIAVAICDRIHFLSERTKLQLFNSVAMCGCGLCFLPLGFLSPDSSAIAIGCFTASISCLGIVTCGSLKCVPMVSRVYSGFVMSIVQLVICSGSLIVPVMVNILTPDNTIAQWRAVFFCTCAVLCITNGIFCLLCSAEPEPWAVQNAKNPPGAVSLSNPKA